MTSRAVVLRPPLRRWECPSCGAQHVTRDARAITPMHGCRALKGFSVPYVEVLGRELKKRSVTHRVVERGDWVGKEKVHTDGDGKPVMAVHTERADGHDTHVYAPAAHAEIRY